MNGLKNAEVLITGGGSSLGWAPVERFSRESARVAVPESSAARAATLRVDFGEEVEAIVGDVKVSTLYRLPASRDPAPGGAFSFRQKRLDKRSQVR